MKGLKGKGKEEYWDEGERKEGDAREGEKRVRMQMAGREGRKMEEG